MRVDLAQKREGLREAIREAAIAEFAELGLRGASTQGIADRAGISKTRLHYYISSKEELYEEALDHIIDIWARLAQDLPLDQGPEAFLADYVARKVDFSLDHPAKVKMFTSEVLRGAPMLRSHWAGSREATLAVVRRIERWMHEGKIRPLDPLLLLVHLWSMTEAYAVIATEIRYMMGLPEDAKLDRTLIAREITDLVLRGIRP